MAAKEQKTVFFSNIFRYLIVVIFLLAVLFYGQNIGESVAYSPEEFNLSNSVFYSNHIIQTNESNVIVNDIINSNKGDFYRLTFAGRAETADKENTSKSVDITPYLISKIGEKQALKTVPVQYSRDFQSQEIIFETDQSYSDLVFEKSAQGEGSLITIDNIRINRLNLNDWSKAARLAPTIFGDVNYSLENEGIGNVPTDSVLSTFLRGHQIVGEVFKSKDEYISSVELKMHFFGNGGNGNYSLELREVNEKDGKFTVADNVLAYFDFDSIHAEKFYQINQSDIFQLPISAKVEKGKYYFVGINDKSVKHNVVNNLRLLGTKDSKISPDCLGGKVGRGGKIVPVGNFYFKVYGAGFKNINGTRMLHGAKFEDMGDGTGLFTFKLSHNPIDILNVDSYQIDQKARGEIKNRVIRFDLSKKAIVAPAAGETYYVYKIDTIYPYSKFYLDSNQINGEEDVKIYFSKDAADWQLLSQNDGFFQNSNTVLAPGNKSTSIYLKVAYNDNPMYKKYNQPQFFGLKELNLAVSVDMK